MKQIRIIKMSLKNFKGVEVLDVDINGNDLNVYGSNGTGKTTLQDAFQWLLFGKDSNNRADFAIKRLDKDGNVIHNLEHEVEVLFSVSGQELTLRKMYKEKYTKKRGSATSEFTGHETNHYIDGVPFKKGEYEKKVNEVIPEEIFKLVTSPTYFNEQLDWKARRKEIIAVCGDVSERLKDIERKLQSVEVKSIKSC